MADSSDIPEKIPLAMHIQPILLTPAEAARALGISERLLWELTKKKKEIASVNVGAGEDRQSLRYLTEDLLAWARSRRNGQPPPAA